MTASHSLIGEHIDYALFGCLPAAVERDILIACAPRVSTDGQSGEVNAQNRLEKYVPARFTPTRRPSQSAAEAVRVEEWHLDIDQKVLHWESYVKAGYYGVLNNYFASTSSSPAHSSTAISAATTASDILL